MAARAGGADASKNGELARVLKEAAIVKLPKDNVERALAKARDQKDTSDFSQGTYHVQGSRGTALVVQTLTDNPTRAVKEIKEVVRRNEAKFVTGGVFGFSLKAVLRASAPYAEDTVLEAAIDSGVDSVDFAPAADGDEDNASPPPPPLILTEPESLALLQDALAAAGIPTTAGLEHVASADSRVRLDVADLERSERLVEALEALGDVDAVFHNLEF